MVQLKTLNDNKLQELLTNYKGKGVKYKHAVKAIEAEQSERKVKHASR
jgi:hypothetical protein